MKVLTVIPSSFKFTSETTNGLVIGARSLMKALHDNYNVQFEVLAEFAKNYKEDWYTARPVDYSSIRRHQVKLFRELSEILTNEKFDLVHIHSNFYLAVSIENKLKKFNVPIIVTHHSSFIPGIASNANRNKVATSFNNVHMTFPSSTVYDDICKYYSKELPQGFSHTIIPNIVDLQELDISYKKNQIAIISRTDPVKNIVFTLSKAIKDVREANEQGLNYKIILVSDTNILVPNKSTDSLLENTQKLIRDNSDIIEYHEYMTRNEISKLLSESKLLYHFSKYESQGLTAAEANENGCVVVGYKEVLVSYDYEGNKLVSQSKNSNSYENFILSSLDTNPYAIKDAYNKHLNKQDVIKRWYDFYSSVISSK